MQQKTDRAATLLPRCPASCLLLVIGAALAGCGPNYSPNTYDAAAVQQANKVDQAVIVGVRQVGISATTTVGTVAGGAVGGAAGNAAGDGLGIGSTLGAIGGSVLGGIVGSTVEHTTNDTQAYEYIVRKSNGELMSVTQKDETPLVIGTHVLVIAGKQARIVPDYTVTLDSDKAAPKKAEEAKPAAKSAETAPPPAPASAGEPKTAASAGEQKTNATSADEQKTAASAGAQKPAAGESKPGDGTPDAAPESAHVDILETPLSQMQSILTGSAPSALAEPPAPDESKLEAATP